MSILVKTDVFLSVEKGSRILNGIFFSAYKCLSCIYFFMYLALLIDYKFLTSSGHMWTLSSSVPKLTGSRSWFNETQACTCTVVVNCQS